MSNKTLTQLIVAVGISLTACNVEWGHPDNRDPRQMLEPIAQAWTGPVGSSANYTHIEDARKAVYRLADTDGDGKVNLSEARAMVERCPKSDDYNCK